MKAEQTIAEIERLGRIFAAPDTRPLSPSDISAANRRHDEMLAHSPWFRFWLPAGNKNRAPSRVRRDRTRLEDVNSVSFQPATGAHFP
jgi:hypothetical protein